MEAVLLILIFLVLLIIVPYMMNKHAVIQVVKRLRQLQSLDIDSAKTVYELGLQTPSFRERLFRFRDYKPSALQGLIQAGIVQMTEDGRLYLSEEKLKNSKLATI